MHLTNISPIFFRQKAHRLVTRYKPEILFYRAGYGGKAAVAAKEHGALLIVYHTLIHPDDLLKLGQLHFHKYGTRQIIDSDPYNRQAIFDMEIADLIVTNSEFVKESLAQNSLSADRIIVIPEGIDALTETLARDENLIATPDKGPVKLIFAGSIDSRKGFPELLEALCRIDTISLSLDAYGHIAENSDFLGRIKDMKHSITLHSSIPRDVLMRRMGQASIFVFPSHAEGAARVLYEAAAMGLPIITTRAGGSFIEHRKHGLLVDPNDIEGIASAIETLATDRVLAAQFGKSARQEILKNYMMSNLEEKVIDFINNAWTENRKLND